jgi:hypothetical protein
MPRNHVHQPIVPRPVIARVSCSKQRCPVHATNVPRDLAVKFACKDHRKSRPGAPTYKALREAGATISS